jgi:hypothetical protein
LDARPPNCTVFSVEEAAVAGKWKRVQEAEEKLKKKNSKLAVEHMKVPSIRYLKNTYRKHKNERRMHRTRDETSN